MAIGVVVVVAVVVGAGEEGIGVEVVAVAVHELFYSVTLIQIYPLIDDTIANGIGKARMRILWHNSGFGGTEYDLKGEAMPSGMGWRDGKTLRVDNFLTLLDALPTIPTNSCYGLIKS